jgi:peptidoglycan/xylan/chitin deacetylase (PgdA/CDA1 family)
VREGYRRTGVLVAGLALAVACSSGTAKPPSPTVGPTADGTAPAPAVTVDPAAVHANELGAVPVLMYHQLLPRPTGVYDQTPGQFRAELDLLYRSGYRTVTAADLVAGRVDVPAGRSPMVLTFDDSTVSQYRERADGSVDPASAVGILLAVAHRYGEDHPVATFYVNAAPFARRDAYLASLVRLGMELGDHTATHANLRQLDDAGVQRELVEGLAVITRAVPGTKVTTMALPFGAHPRNAVLAHRGRGYAFAGVLLVGSNPSRSPYSKAFDALAVPRIRSGLRTGDQAFTSTYWLPRLRSTRFVSDGDPATISFPRALSDRLNPRLRDRARPY